MFKKLFHNNGSKKPKRVFEDDSFGPETHDAVIRASICTGEKVAGFKDKQSGQFTEVMLIRSDKDLEEFRKKYKVDTIKTIY